MSKKQTSFSRQTVQDGANLLFMLLEELRDCQLSNQVNGHLRQMVADAWLYIGALKEQGVVPEGFDGFHQHYVQQAQMQARVTEQRKQKPPWTEEDVLQFQSALRAAADMPASLSPMDVYQVFERARRKQIDEEQLRQWLLMQPDLYPGTRRVLETALYGGSKAF